MKTGHLPADMAMTLGSKVYPTPPALSAPPHIPAPPSTPQRASGHHASASSFVPPSPTPTQTLRTPHSAPGVSAPFGPSPSRTPIHAGNWLNTIQPTASPFTPRAPTLTQQRNAAALVIVREEAFRADQEDFWVVFTGTAPGVHQGR